MALAALDKLINGNDLITYTDLLKSGLPFASIDQYKGHEYALAHFGEALDDLIKKYNIVYVPKGVYTIDNSVMFYSNKMLKVIIFENGAVINNSGTFYDAMFIFKCLNSKEENRGRVYIYGGEINDITVIERGNFMSYYIKKTKYNGEYFLDLNENLKYFELFMDEVTYLAKASNFENPQEMFAIRTEITNSIFIANSTDSRQITFTSSASSVEFENKLVLKNNQFTNVKIMLYGYNAQDINTFSHVLLENNILNNFSFKLKTFLNATGYPVRNIFLKNNTNFTYKNIDISEIVLEKGTPDIFDILQGEVEEKENSIFIDGEKHRKIKTGSSIIGDNFELKTTGELYYKTTNKESAEVANTKYVDDSIQSAIGIAISASY